MKKTIWIPALALVGLFSLACGGGGASKFGSVEFTTYKAGRTKITFNAGGTVTRKWSNMSGSPVKGEWVQTGEEIEIHWDDAATNFTGRHAKLKQMGPCSIAEYWSKDEEGKIRDEEPRIYEQVKPACNTLQVR